MKRRLAEERFSHRIKIATLLLSFVAVAAAIVHVFAAKINYGDQVEEDTPLTYYITVTSDGIDSEGINSEDGTRAEVYGNKVDVEDVIPKDLIFEGFETTPNGHFTAVAQNDHSIACSGSVIDDTQEEGAAEGHWNNDQTEYYYHGLHYNAASQKVTFSAKDIQAGCEVTIGVKVRTPHVPVPSYSPSRYDFYNTAYVTDNGLTSPSNETYFWVGNQNEILYTLTYEYSGDVPENAPALPETRSYGRYQNVIIANQPELYGYAFDGWKIKNTNNYATTPFSIYDNITLVGSFSAQDEPNPYPVSYEVTGTKPAGYTVPETQDYYQGDNVIVDGLAANQKIGAYVFSGWDSDDVEIENTNFTMPGESVVLRGSFDYETYDVSYEFSGEAPENATALLPETTSYEAGDTVVVADDPSATGWEFLGWNRTGAFTMPEEDVVITGVWRRLGDKFEPTITKTITNPQDKFHKDDVVEFDVVIENTADYPIYQVIVYEDNAETSYLEGEGYTVTSPQFAEIDSIPAHGSITLKQTNTVLRNADETITDTSTLISAIAEGYNSLDTSKEYAAMVVFETEATEDQGIPVDEDETKDNPDTIDHVAVFAIISGVALAIAALFIVKSKRRFSSKKPLFVIIALPLVAGLSFLFFKNFGSALSFQPHATGSSAESSNASFEDKEGDSWKVYSSAHWTGADTADLELTFESNHADQSQPIDLVIGIANDNSISSEQFAEYKAEVMEYAQKLLQENEQNRIGIMSLNNMKAVSDRAQVLLAPNRNLSEIESAIDQIGARKTEYSYYNIAPLDAAKLIISADDGIERQPHVVAIGMDISTVTDSYWYETADGVRTTTYVSDFYTPAKQLLPNLQYNILYTLNPNEPIYYYYSHIFEGVADSVLADYDDSRTSSKHDGYTLEDAATPAHSFNFTINDVVNTDEFTIVRSFAYAEPGTSLHDTGYTLRDDYGTSSSWQENTDGATLSTIKLRSGSLGHLVFKLRLNNPDSEEHQVYHPNRSFDIDIETISNSSAIAHEHYEIHDELTLTNGYAIIYDANAPEGCNPNAPAKTIHNAQTIATVSTSKLTCPGYNFVGFAILDDDLENITNNSFYMPSRDVTVRGAWVKSGVKLDLDGELASTSVAYLMRGSNFNDRVKYLAGGADRIKAFKTASEIPEGFNTADTTNRLSDDQSPIPVHAWFDADTGTIYTYSNAETIYVNDDAYNMLSYMSNLTDISALADWDTSKSRSLDYMFQSDYSLSDFSPIANWNIGKATTIAGMFTHTAITNADALENWDLSSMKNTVSLFAYTDSLTDISALENWDTTSVETMANMFLDTSLTNFAPIHGWNTENVTNMSQMFYNTKVSLSALENWNVEKVTTMESMFYNYGYGDKYTSRYLTETNLNSLSSWKPKQLTNLSMMFYGQANLTNISAMSSWTTYMPSVTNIDYIFQNTGLTSLVGLENLKTDQLTSLRSPFSSTSVTDLTPIRDWNVSNISSMNKAFYYMTSLTNISALSGWQTTSLTNITDAFVGSDAITDFTPLNSWDVSRIADYYKRGAFDNYQKYNTTLPSWYPQS